MSRSKTYDPSLDVDTNDKGVVGPFESWEGDHTAFVHVLWHAEHSGWMARRPSARQPLRRAIFDRIISRDTNGVGGSNDRIIDDLRSILDAHEAVDGRTLEDADLTEDQRNESDGVDMTATALRHSRALAAQKAFARADGMRLAAHYFRDLSSEKIDRHEVIRLLEYLADQEPHRARGDR